MKFQELLNLIDKFLIKGLNEEFDYVVNNIRVSPNKFKYKDRFINITAFKDCLFNNYEFDIEFKDHYFVHLTYDFNLEFKESYGEVYHLSDDIKALMSINYFQRIRNESWGITDILNSIEWTGKRPYSVTLDKLMKDTELVNITGLINNLSEKDEFYLYDMLDEPYNGDFRDYYDSELNPITADEYDTLKLEGKECFAELSNNQLYRFLAINERDAKKLRDMSDLLILHDEENSLYIIPVDWYGIGWDLVGVKSWLYSYQAKELEGELLWI